MSHAKGEKMSEVKVKKWECNKCKKTYETEPLKVGKSTHICADCYTDKIRCESCEKEISPVLKNIQGIKNVTIFEDGWTSSHTGYCGCSTNHHKPYLHILDTQNNPHVFKLKEEHFRCPECDTKNCGYSFYEWRSTCTFHHGSGR